MLRRLLARLIGENPPGFQYEAIDSGLWRCLNCHPTRVVWRDQLAYHAQVKHGFKAANVRIYPLEGVPHGE